MTKNYLTIAFRVFKRDKAYSFLNILGLTVGITASVLLFAYSFNEAQYDQHHEKKERIMRVVMDVKFGDEARGVAVVPAALGYYMKEQAKEVEAYAMLRPISDFQIKRGEEVIAEKGMYYASQGVLDIFTWQWLAGDKATALTPHNTIVLSRSLAVKYFGSVGKAVGAVINRDTGVSYQVTGVIEDACQKGHFSPQAFVSLWDDSKTTNWRDWNWCTYLLLAPNVGDYEEIHATLQKAFDQNLAPQLAQGGGGTIDFYIQRLTDIYYESRRDFEMEPNEGNRVFIRGFAIVGCFLLLLAVINYINLVTAQSEKRAREVGVKKVFGVSSNALRGQFFTEAFVYVAVSVLASAVLLFPLQPLFTYFTGNKLPLFMLFEWKGIAGVAAFVFLVSLMSGVYPAFYISSFQPSRALKSGTLLSEPGGTLNLRKMLIGVQLSVSLLMIIGILGVFMQLQFISQYNLGFDKEKVLKFNLPNAAVGKYHALREALLKNPSISGVATAIELPGEKPPVNDFSFETDEGEKREIFQMIRVDEGFFTTLRIPLIAGSNFKYRSVDSISPGVLVNRAFVKHAGWKMDEVPGKTLSSHDWSDKVVGVVEDFHVISLHGKIEPLIFRYTSSAASMVVKFTGPADKTMAIIQKVATDVAGEKLAAWSFLDADFQKQYEKDEKRADLLAAFAFVVLFIACLGLLGMAAYDMKQRRKEIGIRKILGASSGSLLLRLFRTYLRIVVLAALVSIPVANYLLTEWLSEFAYRIEVHMWMLLAPVFLLLLVAVSVVSFQFTRAINSNPAQMLRYE